MLVGGPVNLVLVKRRRRRGRRKKKDREDRKHLYGSMKSECSHLYISCPHITHRSFFFLNIFCCILKKKTQGTLGVITSITVKLHPIPQHIIAAVCVFDKISDAANTVAMLKLHDISGLARCELLDKTSVAAFNTSLATSDESSSSSSSSSSSVTTKKMEEKPTLFLEFQASTQQALDEQISITQEICINDFNGTNFQFTSNEDERKALWAARHNLYYASIAYRKGCTTAVLTDSCVPISKFANVIEDTINDINSLGVIGPCFGHAGDGNFHCILPIKDGTNDDDKESDEYMSKVFTIHENIIQRTLDAGGTCTGEHGKSVVYVIVIVIVDVFCFIIFVKQKHARVPLP
jgi:D-lactate dehydrogenase (cytochrome)